MNINKNISRWIKASINKHFDSIRGSIPMIDENEADLSKAKNEQTYFEVRLNGPRFLYGSDPDLDIEIEISVVCTAKLTNDLYLIERTVGMIQAAMVPIPVKKLGDTEDDDQSTIGCLTLRENIPRPVDTLPWGQLDPSFNITQTVVEGFYKLTI